MTVTDHQAPERPSADRSRKSTVRPSAPKPHPVTVYEPTKTGLPPLIPYFRGVVKRWPFIWHDARSDLKAENYGTLLGQVWLLLSPLLLALVLIIGRSFIRPLGSPEQRNFLIAHLIGALFFYQYVTGVWNYAGRSILSNRRMVMNSAFPRMVFPLSATLRGFAELLPLLAALFIARALLDQPFDFSLWALPLVVVLLTMFALGIGLATAAIMVFFRDFNNVVTLITRLWLWASPVLYTTDEVPEGIRPYMMLNPLFPFYQALEDIWAGHNPSADSLLWSAGWAFGAIIIGGIVFLARERDFGFRL